MDNKLEGFGPVYIINLKRRQDRREITQKQLIDYNVNDYTFVDGIDYKEENLNLFYTNGGGIEDAETACTLAHLQTVKYWLENSNTDYAIILEDDVSFETLKYWNFTWQEFMQSLDFEYDLLQLSVTDWQESASIEKWKDGEFGATAYLIKRDFAQSYVDQNFKNGKWDLPHNPISDRVFYSVSRTYSWPLFIYGMDTPADVHPGHREGHENSKNKIMNYLQTYGLHLKKGE